MIRNVTLEDARALAEIYNYYILNTIITFEEIEITAEEMENRIRSRNAKLPWLVFEEEKQVVGFAYAQEWKSRSAYRFTVESSIYLSETQNNKGLGTKLYTELINQLVDLNIHSIIGGIALPNDPSIHLHENFGFDKVAHFKEVGFKFGKWVDVGYWELIV